MYMSIVIVILYAIADIAYKGKIGVFFFYLTV